MEKIEKEKIVRTPKEEIKQLKVNAIHGINFAEKVNCCFKFGEKYYLKPLFKISKIPFQDEYERILMDYNKAQISLNIEFIEKFIQAFDDDFSEREEWKNKKNSKLRADLEKLEEENDHFFFIKNAGDLSPEMNQLLRNRIDTFSNLYFGGNAECTDLAKFWKNIDINQKKKEENGLNKLEKYEFKSIQVETGGERIPSFEINDIGDKIEGLNTALGTPYP